VSRCAPALTDGEAGQSFRGFFGHVDRFDLSAARTFAAERHESLHRVFFALEDRLHRAVPAVCHRTAHVVLLREASYGVAKEDALHTALDDDTTADHAAYSRERVEFKEILRRRRMVRAYEPQPVARETLERIVGTIRRAPSAGFSQGQRFVVVTDAERRKAIADAVGESFYVEQGFAPWISGAAALIVVCTREDDYHDRYRQPDKLLEGEEIEWPVPYWHADAGKATMLVLLAAIDEGLAAGVFGVPADRMQSVRELLDLPRDVAIVEVITLGHPATDDVSDRLSSRGTRPRRPLDELVHWERWG
jgi:FMN reductase [NAD(P)H]